MGNITKDLCRAMYHRAFYLNFNAFSLRCHQNIRLFIGALYQIVYGLFGSDCNK